MTMWTKIYCWFRDLKTPEWLKSITEYLTINVLYPTLKALGKDGKELLINLIIRASKDVTLSNPQKARWVFYEFNNTFTKELPDNVVNIGIEMLYAQLKKQGLL